MFRKKKRKKNEAEAGFAEPDLEPPSRPRLRADDVQRKEFRLALRGYHEGEVDEFLDLVTEELAALHEENKRLREQLGDPSGGPPDLQAADQRAEQIVREAREHAARLVAEAEKRAGEVGGGGGAPPTPGWYLLQERDFLERLASLVKEHAEDLKRQARGPARGQEGNAVEPPGSTAPVAHPAPAEKETGQEDVVVVDLVESSEERGREEPGDEEATPGKNDTESEVLRLENTAPMSAVATPAGEPDLLSEWEAPGGSGDASRRRRPDDDSSLKELFWGEDS